MEPAPETPTREPVNLFETGNGRPGLARRPRTPSPILLPPPSSAIKAAAILGVSLDAEAADVDTGETDASQEAPPFSPPTPPPSPVTPYMKCSACRGINLQALSSKNGYRHLPDWQELPESSKTCKLCHLLWEEGEIGLVESYKIKGGGPLTCTLHTMHGTIFMLAQSSGYRFHSRLAIFIQEDDPLSEVAISLRRWNLANSSGKALDLVARVEKAQPSGMGNSLLRSLPLRRNLSTTRSGQSLDTAKGWIEACTKNHEHCQMDPTGRQRQLGHTMSPPAAAKTPTGISSAGPPPNASSLASPTRLIDLQFFGTECHDALLFSTEGRSLEYVTLSYCWGRTGDRSYITTSSSLVDGSRVLRHLTMPQTIRDAFQICRTLGFRYLWVDAICIIQDSKHDWHSQALNMASIYRNSHLTISVDLSDSVELGCFNKQSISQTDYMRDWVVRITQAPDDEHGRKSSLFFYRPPRFPILEGIIDGSPLSSRGWAFQERALSRRLLHFTGFQLVWECQELYLAEDGLQIFDHERQVQPRTLCSLLRRDHSHLDRERLVLEWYKSVTEPYSSRKFTFWTDRLIALSGLAEEMGPKTGSAYVAGLWTLGLEFGLCWRRCGAPHENGTLTAVGPSFSWAGLIAPVVWPVDPKSRGDCRSLITLVDHEYRASFLLAAEVAGVPTSTCTAWLRIRGRIRPVFVRVTSTGDRGDGSDSDEDGDNRAHDGEWLKDALYEGGSRSGRAVGHVALDTDYAPDETCCLPLHVDEFDEIYGLLIQRLPRRGGEYPWRRIGLARVHTPPTGWLIGDMQEVLLV